MFGCECISASASEEMCHILSANKFLTEQRQNKFLTAKRQNRLAAPTITFFTHNVIFLRTTEKQLMHLDLERVIFRVNLFSDALASLELRMYFSPLGVIKKVIQVAVVRTFFFS